MESEQKILVNKESSRGSVVMILKGDSNRTFQKNPPINITTQESPHSHEMQRFIPRISWRRRQMK